MSADAELIAALKEAGHDEAADYVRDTGLAAQLEAAGYDDLAGGLKAKLGTGPTPEPAGSPEEAQGRALLDLMERDGIIDRRED